MDSAFFFQSPESPWSNPNVLSRPEQFRCVSVSFLNVISSFPHILIQRKLFAFHLLATADGQGNSDLRYFSLLTIWKPFIPVEMRWLFVSALVFSFKLILSIFCGWIKPKTDSHQHARTHTQLMDESNSVCWLLFSARRWQKIEIKQSIQKWKKSISEINSQIPHLGGVRNIEQSYELIYDAKLLCVKLNEQGNRSIERRAGRWCRREGGRRERRCSIWQPFERVSVCGESEPERECCDARVLHSNEVESGKNARCEYALSNVDFYCNGRNNNWTSFVVHDIGANNFSLVPHFSFLFLLLFACLSFELQLSFFITDRGYPVPSNKTFIFLSFLHIHISQGCTRFPRIRGSY